jgi:hypothetical protein
MIFQPFLPESLGVLSNYELNDTTEEGEQAGPQSEPSCQPEKALQGLVDPSEAALEFNGSVIEEYEREHENFNDR